MSLTNLFLLGLNALFALWQFYCFTTSSGWRSWLYCSLGVIHLSLVALIIALHLSRIGVIG